MTTTTRVAVPAAGRSGPGVLVLHAWWGLNETFRDVCDRLADEGFVALAPDLYGDSRVLTTVDEAETRMEAADGNRISNRVESALDELLAHPALIGRQVGVIGFSMGAWQALKLSQDRSEVAAVVAFYGTSDGDFSASHAAYLGHYAPGDDWEPDDEVAALEASLRAAARPVTFERYAGAKHWFFEPDRPEYDPAAAALAWTRTIAFLREQLGPLGA
jgi:carboxymethylenebutenolidase